MSVTTANAGGDDELKQDGKVILQHRAGGLKGADE
jgi:hypothetical protein